ncbi:MAG: GDSL-type esterase/lipase family protein [Alkalispirochaeta sp.]
MKTILCFGDSNTWAYVPGSDGGRAALDDRWPSVLEATLNTKAGERRAYQVIAEGLNGRTTVFDDPFSPGRSGIAALPMLLDTHAPLDLVIIMLGTNDTKNFFGVSAEQIARGMARLAEAVAVSEAGPVADSRPLADAGAPVEAVSDAGPGADAAVEAVSDAGAVSNPGAGSKARGHAVAAGPIWPPARSVPRLLIVALAPIGDLNDDMRPHFALQERAMAVSRELAGVYRRLAEEMGTGFFDAAPVAEVGSDGVHLTVAGQRSLGTVLAGKVREFMGG